MIFEQELITNGRNNRNGMAQWNEVVGLRRAFELNETNHHRIMRAQPGMTNLVTNEGLIPRDVYQAFDNQTLDRFRADEGDVFLNALLPLSRSINIGKLVQRFRRASDAGNAQTSMTGQIGVLSDNVDFNYDGTLVPIHDVGFHRNWREMESQRSEGFDALIDDQRESLATLRQLYVSTFLNGQRDKQGQLINVDGLTWEGMRADSRVAQVDLGPGGIAFDFTDPTQTGEDIKAAFIQVRDVLRITNNFGRDLTFYISRQIGSVWEQRFSTQYDARTIQQEMQNLMGIATIQETSALTGNEMMAYSLDGEFVYPLVGMGINTVPIPRPMYNSDYAFIVWGAAGWVVKTDFFGNQSALFAQELT